MTVPIYTFAYTNPYHSTIIGTTTTIGFFSNSLLIYIVFTTKSDHIGSYRYLLCFFAICNFSTAIGHASMEWCCHMTSSGFYFFPRYAGGFIFGVPWATVFCWMFIVTYYQVFLILAFHFVYRYKTATRGFESSFTDDWKMRHWIAVAIVAYILYISAFVSTVAIGMAPDEQTRRDAPAEIVDTYGIDLSDPRTGFIVLAMRRVDPETNTVYWSTQSTISIGICMLLFGGTGAVVVFCIARTNSAIRSEESRLPLTMRGFQRQLFRALLIQTTIPCVFSYTPLATILLFGALTGISLGSFGNVLFLITVIFPSVDSFFVLLFIPSIFGLSMTVPIYTFAYTNPYHSTIIGTTTTIGFFSNSLLIYIVFTTKSDHIGSYRYLLCFFAICNFSTAIGHASMEWCCHMTSSGFYFFPRYAGGFIFGVPWATVFCWMFIVTYYQVFLILAFHFVYRYKTATRGFESSFTDDWKMRHWIAVAIVAYILYISAFVSTVAIGMAPDEQTRRDAPAEIVDTYGIDLSDPRTGFIVLAMRRVDPETNTVYWSTQSTISIGICMLLFGGTGAVVVFCIARTNSAIRSEESRLPLTMRGFQRQLFRALLIQTTIPCVFSYTPLATILLFGALTGISLGSFGNVLFLITVIFPSVDSFFVLLFIVRFRQAVIKLFQLPFEWTMGGLIAPAAITTNTNSRVTTATVSTMF